MEGGSGYERAILGLSRSWSALLPVANSIRYLYPEPKVGFALRRLGAYPVLTRLRMSWLIAGLSLWKDWWVHKDSNLYPLIKS
jgi:hypothetical protein